MKPPRWHAAAAVLFVCAGSLRIVSTYRIFNHTIDEPDNLAAGMEYLSTGRYLYEDIHPPLARVLGAAGPYLAGERFQAGPKSYREGYRILGGGSHYDRVLALGRAGILPFFWIASLVVYRWGRRAGGPAAAALGTLLFTTVPAVLALAGTINTDAADCAMTAAAGLGAIWWAERPDGRRSPGFGALLGLAMVSKFLAIPFLAATYVLMGACYLAAARRTPAWMARQAWALRWQLALAGAAAALVVWATYGFTFARVDFAHLRLPAPRFFTGLHDALAQNRAGRPSYFLGRRSGSGFWYYFPADLMVKTPLGTLALAAASLVVLVRGKRRLEVALPLALTAGVLLASLAFRADLGIRYVLPAYAGLAVAGGCAAARARGGPAVTAVVLCLAWAIGSGVARHPDYLAYTNEIAGRQPERFVADSDLDWGQDMKRLAEYLQRAGADHVTFSPFNRTYLMPLAMSDAREDGPSHGWNAASITLWKVFGFPPWVDRMPPGHRVGRSILVWWVE